MNKIMYKRFFHLRIALSILVILMALITSSGSAWANTPPISENDNKSNAKDLVFDSINEAANLTAQKTVSPGIERLADSNRYKTCLKVADALKKELKSTLKNGKFDSIIVASGQAFPDALSGTYAANKLTAPILIVSNNGNNSEMIAYAKNNINTGGTIYVLGGESAVSKKVFNSLKGVPGVKVERLSGSNRYDTNLEILKKMKPDGEDLLVCSGKNFPDALSASAAGKPILLVGDSLTAAQKKWLKDNISKIKNIYIIGGTGAVSSGIEKALNSYKAGAQRIYGTNRYTTSVEVARTFFSFTIKEAVMASGLNFPDGLVGGPLAYAKGAPLILSDNKSFYPAYKYVYSNKPITRVTILGGEGLISDDASGLTNKGGRKNGLLSVGVDKYYTDSNGNLIKNKFIDVGKSRYYFSNTGAAYRNTTFKVSGKSYGATSSGALVKSGWASIAGTYHNFKDYIIIQDRVYQNPKNMVQISQTISTHGLSYYTSPVQVKPWSTRSEHVEAMIKRAYDYLGDTYVVCRSGKPGQGVDCSGLVMQACYAAGVDLWPSNPYRHQFKLYEYESRHLFKMKTLEDVSWSNRKRGDLIFYSSNGIIMHVAIYLGNDKIIHAWPGKIRISSVHGWGTIAGVKRIFH